MCRKIHFCQNSGKKGPKRPQDTFFFEFFWKILSVFLGNNLKQKLILLLIFEHQFHLWQNSGSRVMGQIAVSQSNCRILYKCSISRKKWMMKFIFGMQINSEVFYKWIPSLWVCPTRHAQSAQHKKFVYLCNISRKAWGWSWYFSCKKIQKSFLQINSITLGMCSQACSKYPKQWIYNTFVKSQGKREGWTWTFAYR